MPPFRSSALGLALVACVACGEGTPAEGSRDELPSERNSVSFSVIPRLAEVAIGDTVRLAAWNYRPDGNRVRVTATYSPAGGTISEDGLYTAGSTPGSYKVIAVQHARPHADTAVIRVTARPVTSRGLVLTPASLTLNRGQTHQFSVSESWSDSTVSSPAASYFATGGSISAAGLYTAGEAPGTYHVIAVRAGYSEADTSLVVIVATPSPPPTLEQLVLVPAAVTLTTGGSQQFSASGTWSDGSKSNPVVIYSATGGSIGATTGRFTAGLTPGAYEIVATHHSSRADTSSIIILPIGETAIHPGTPIQQVVNQNPAGTRFVLKAGIHTRQTVTPKDRMEFRGEPGAVLDGQDVTRFAFNGGATAVQIRDLEITRYSSDSILGAIQGYDAYEWTLEHLNVHHNAGYGANLRGRFMVLGGTFHHNGRLGIGVTQGTGAVIDGVNMSYNNPNVRFDPLWEAGGIKISLSSDVTVRGCHVHDNVGPGIWYDGENRGSVIADNIVRDNTHVGIMYEISQAGTIKGNTVSGNGTVHKGVYGSGILIVSSQDVEVHDNVLSGNSNGIVAHREARGSGTFGVREVRNLWVHDNDIDQRFGSSGMLDFIGDNAMLRTLNNRFDRNRYDVRGNSMPFYAGSLSPTTISGWRGAGQDSHSTFIGP